ncbi:hypothetical protein J6590_054409 [Homalodisca vitripennis]|nr:hypothetical protein J6590_054409 [Homalodisca vitripennis]
MEAIQSNIGCHINSGRSRGYVLVLYMGLQDKSIHPQIRMQSPPSLMFSVNRIQDRPTGRYSGLSSIILDTKSKKTRASALSLPES